MLFHLFHLCPAEIIYEDMEVKLQKGSLTDYEYLTAEFAVCSSYY